MNEDDSQVTGSILSSCSVAEVRPGTIDAGVHGPCDQAALQYHNACVERPRRLLRPYAETGLLIIITSRSFLVHVCLRFRLFRHFPCDAYITTSMTQEGRLACSSVRKGHLCAGIRERFRLTCRIARCNKWIHLKRHVLSRLDRDRQSQRKDVQEYVKVSPYWPARALHRDVGPLVLSVRCADL